MAGEDYKAGYNGVFRATVVAPPAGQGGIWVVCPRLNGNAAMGPCDSYAGTSFTPGTQVLVATVAGIKDDLVVIQSRHA